MNYTGIFIGLATFLIIGVFHPIVIKAEYYFSKRCWWAFALAGVIFAVISLLVADVVWSSLSIIQLIGLADSKMKKKGVHLRG